jgi:hypothetical protein
MDKKKRQQFSLKEKREILLGVEKGRKKEVFKIFFCHEVMCQNLS